MLAVLRGQGNTVLCLLCYSQDDSDIRRAAQPADRYIPGSRGCGSLWQEPHVDTTASCSMNRQHLQAFVVVQLCPSINQASHCISASAPSVLLDISRTCTVSERSSDCPVSIAGMVWCEFVHSFAESVSHGTHLVCRCCSCRKIQR